MVKHSTLIFGFFAVLGAIFLTIVVAIFYWSNIWSAEILAVAALIPKTYLSNIMKVFPILGTIFLTAGILGIGRQHITNHKNLFTVLTDQGTQANQKTSSLYQVI
jgi:glycerol uptake facilitator-like aquaporin